MFNFFGSLFHKTIVLFVGLVASMGLVSAIPQNTPKAPTSSIPQIAVQRANLTSSSEITITPSPVKKRSIAPAVDLTTTPQDQSKKATTQPQPIVNTPPPNETLCNGTYYPNCSTGYNFVCSTAGGADCQISQQQQQANDLAAQQAAARQQAADAQVAQQAQQAQAAAAQQQKINKANALTSAYNTQYDALQQQIVNIKSQYYTDLANIENSRTNFTEAQGEEQNLLNQDNAKIAQIQQQEQQLQLTYQEQLRAVQ